MMSKNPVVSRRNNRNQGKRKNPLLFKYSPDRVLYEKGRIETIQQFQNEMKNEQFTTDDELRDYLMKRLGRFINIKFQYETVDNGENAHEWNVKDRKIIRVSLSTKKSTKILTDFEQLCKGLVFSYPDWEQLTYPTRVLRTVSRQTKLEDVLKNIDLYKVYRMYDGTLINLFFQKKWVISSTSGIELNKMTWLGNTTYEDAFFELLGDDKDNLISTHTYTFVMKHKDFHPVDGHDYGLTLIQEFDLQKREYLTTSSLKTIQFQEELEVNDKLVEQIKHEVNNGETAYYEFSDNISSETTFKKPVYGYIFRTLSDKVPKDLGNLTVETRLYYKMIRSIYRCAKPSKYEVKTNPTIDEEGLVEIDDEGIVAREKYLIAKLLLRKDGIANQIIKIVPKYKDVCNRIDANIKSLSNLTYQYIVYIHKRSEFENSEENVKKLATKIGKLLLTNNVNPQKQEVKELVSDYIVQLSNAKLYGKYL